MQLHKVHFQVSLNDGSTYQEGQGILQEVEGEVSPWKKLLAYLETHNLSIVSLVLVTEGKQTFTLPSAGKNPNFKPFRELQKPLSYRVERALATETNMTVDQLSEDEGVPSVKEWYTIGVAQYEDYELQVWVSELNRLHCWTLIVPKGK